MTETLQTSTAHDPGTRRRLPERSQPIDPRRVERLLAAEWERFASWSRGSGEHNKRASRSLPLGVTSSFQHWEPYPISIASARGAWLTDVDDNRLLDLSRASARCSSATSTRSSSSTSPRP